MIYKINCAFGLESSQAPSTHKVEICLKIACEALNGRKFLLHIFFNVTHTHMHTFRAVRESQ